MSISAQEETVGSYDANKAKPAEGAEDVIEPSGFDPNDYSPLPPQNFSPAENNTDNETVVAKYDLVAGAEQLIELDLPASEEGSGQSLPGLPEGLFDSLLESEVGSSLMGEFTTITDPSVFPWSRNVKLFFSNDNGNFVCSGALIHPRYILTAGHCVFDFTNGAGFANSMTVIPGFSNGNEPFGAANATNFLTFTGWTQNGNRDFDIAIVELDRPLGAIVGWFGYGWNSSNSFYSGRTMNNPGYPAASPFNGQELQFRFGTYDSIQTERFEFGVTNPGQLPNGTGGHSGSGSYYIENDSRFIHAVHSYKQIGSPIWGHVRMTEGKFDVFQNEIASTTPTSPDLMMLDVEATPDTVDAGDDFTNVSYTIFNNSSASFSGTVSVDLYLSTNTIISTGDTYLGTRTWTGSLTPNGRITLNSTSSPPGIPTGIAAGDYFVGGIITNSDSDTGNNFTLADDTSMVTVTQPSNPPTNDDWNSTIFIADPDFSVTGTNVDATVQTDEQNLENTGSTVWWYVDADVDGELTIDTFGSSYDTQLHVYEFAAAFADLNLIANNDDSGSLQSEVTFNAVAGQCYEIRVGGFTGVGGGAPGSQGNIVLSGSFVPADVGCPGGFELGDVNQDGVLNLLDVTPFGDVIVSGTFQCEADVNEDGAVNLLDVNPFVDLISGG